MKIKTIFIALIGLLIIIVLVVQSCNKDEEKTNQLPSCQITAPNNNSEITKGETVIISVESDDSDGIIAEVLFAIDDVGIGSASSFPYNISWATDNENTGSHIIKATSIDNSGSSTSDEITIELIDGNTPPTAQFTVNPSSGTTTTNFAFDASGCDDNEDSIDQLQVRWDFNGNGSWDTNWDTNKTENHQYSSEGTYTAKLEVKDAEGLTDQFTKSITVSNSFTDPRDGQTYAIVEIGSQTWFAENLNYYISESFCYDWDPYFCSIYGRLYVYVKAKEVCPSGWHLPSDEEWKTLEMALGMSQSEADIIGYRGTNEGEKMKSTSGWINNGNGTNSSGFNAFPSGLASEDDTHSLVFGGKGSICSWWTSTKNEYGIVFYRSLHYETNLVNRSVILGSWYSVRCVKD